MNKEQVRHHIAYKRDGEKTLPAEVAQRMLDALDAGAAPDYQALLTAARWPAPGPVVFHTASASERAVIGTGGLEARDPNANPRWGDGARTIHDGPRPVGDPPDEGEASDEGPVTDDEFAAFADGAGFDPQLPDPTDDELIALHGPSTEPLSDHLDRWVAYSGGLTRHLAEVHGITSPFDHPPFDAGGWEHLDSLHRHAHAGDTDA